MPGYVFPHGKSRNNQREGCAYRALDLVWELVLLVKNGNARNNACDGAADDKVLVVRIRHVCDVCTARTSTLFATYFYQNLMTYAKAQAQNDETAVSV